MKKKIAVGACILAVLLAAGGLWYTRPRTFWEAAGLDPEGRDTILSQVKQFHQETGTTVVLVSHSMEDIAKYADKVLVLDAGHVAMYDTTSAVFARADELLQLGLSVPEVTKVFLRLREWGLDVPADVYTVPYAANILRGMLEKGAGTC